MRSLSTIVSLVVFATFLNPTLPGQVQNTQLLSNLNLGNDSETRDLAVDGNICYVTRNTLGVDIINVTNRANPQKIGNTLNPDPNGTVKIRDVAIHANHAYLIDYSGVVDSNFGNFVGVYIYNVANPTAPQMVGKLLWGDLNVPWSWRAGQCYNGVVGVVAGKPYLFVSSRITNAVEVFDVSNPALPVWKAVVYPPLLGATVHDMEIHGNKLYTAWYSGGFTVHDVSNVGSTTGIGDPYGVQPVTQLVSHQYASAWSTHITPTANGNHVLVTETKSGGRTKIFDISAPNSVSEVASFAGSSNTMPHKPHVRGNLAYVAHWEDGLRVAEISNPSSPNLVAW